MSVRVMTAVWEITLPDSDKIVLLALADCANDEGYCWPSMATLAKKCSKTDRTVQASVKSLVAAGHLTRNEVPGKGCSYVVHPRSDCAPKPVRPEAASPPKGTTLTPEAASDKPSRTIKIKQTQDASAFDAGWEPAEFGLKTKSREIVDGWPPGELESQIEHFTAHHRSKGSKFKDWQDAWSTWVLNSRRFGGRNHGNDRQSGVQRPQRSTRVDGFTAACREVIDREADYPLAGNG